MISEAAFQNWPGGIDNKSRPNRIAEGYARDLLNLDPGPTLKSRIGYEKVVSGTNVRAVMALGRELLFVDGTELKRYSLATDTTDVLAQVAGAGVVCSTVFNEELFISTATETLRYNGELRMWGVPDVTGQPAVAITGQSPGRRFIAMTYVNHLGEEGGTVSAVDAPNGTYEVTVPPLPTGCTARIYVSALNGQTLYLQREVATAGVITVSNPVTDTATLATMHMGAPKPSTILASTRGAILMAAGNAVTATEPLWPHLVDYSKRFVQYPKEVGMVLSGIHGVYISADKCYRVEGVETDSPRQVEALDYPAVPGTGVILPSGAAAWVTRYGMAGESADPREGVLTVNDRFVAGENDSGVSGVVENDGTERLVTVMKRSEGQGNLAACDYYEAEVVSP